MRQNAPVTVYAELAHKSASATMTTTKMTLKAACARAIPASDSPDLRMWCRNVASPESTHATAARAVDWHHLRAVCQVLSMSATRSAQSA